LLENTVIPNRLPGTRRADLPDHLTFSLQRNSPSRIKGHTADPPSQLPKTRTWGTPEHLRISEENKEQSIFGPAMAPSVQAHQRTHGLLLLQKLLNLRDNASPLTLILDSLEQSARQLVREFTTRAKV